MASTDSFKRGVGVGILIMLAAQAIHWLLTPSNHPDASSARTTAVVAQVVGCALAAVWLTRRERLASA